MLLTGRSRDRRARELAVDLARMLRGELSPDDFPWLSRQERQALGALGLSQLRAGRAPVAQAVFGLLAEFEPKNPTHHLMLGHAAAQAEQVKAAYQAFGRAIRRSAADQARYAVAAEAFLARGDLLLRLGRTVEARADLADAAVRLEDPARRRTLETFLAS